MPTEEIQKIKEDFFHEDLKLSPEQVIEFYVNNIFQRTLSRIFGKSGERWIPIEATLNGELKTATVINPAEHIESFSDVVGNDWSTPIEFSQYSSYLNIICLDNPIYCQLSRDGTVWEDPLYLFAFSSISFDFSAKYARFKNVTPGLDGKYYLSVFYS